MMTTNWKSCLAMLFAGTLALTGCSSGKDGASGAPGSDGQPGAGGTHVDTTGINVSVTEVKQGDSGIQVRFKLTDDKGFPVDIAGKYSNNQPIVPKFSLSYLNKDDQGRALPLTVLTLKANDATKDTVLNPAAFDTSGKGRNGAATAPQGTLVENGTGDGDYTYTFPPSNVPSPADGALYKAVKYDPAKLSTTHVLWIEVVRQADANNPDNPRTFTAKNVPYYYVPATGAVSDEKREIATTASCSNCHAGFKPEGSPTDKTKTFHDSARVEPAYCEVCHNPSRASNAATADAMVFVHRIHASEELSNPANRFHSLEATYPQDVRNCAACHAGAAQGDQWKTRPTRAACGSCHDDVDFKTGNNHAGGVETDDTKCTECHTPDAIAAKHVPIAKPDPGNSLVPLTFGQATSGTQGTGDAAINCTGFVPCTCSPENPCFGGGNANTNAAWLAAAGAVPPGAAAITYELSSVVRDANKHPAITFKLKKTLAGTTTDVVFKPCLSVPVYDATKTNQDTNPNQELMDGFVGGPSVYFVYALKQDGITAPADFNASVSGSVKAICNGKAFTTDKTNLVNKPTGTITGPDAGGFYTITLSAVIPDTAVMLTGGVGYTYALPATQPLTQITGLDDTFSYTPDTATTAGVGGLIVPAPDVWKVATDTTSGVKYAERRKIVENAKCNACHAALGVNPTFHAGQRNDAQSCAWCHTANKNSGGWSANAKDIIHGIHAGRVRTTPYTWHGTPTESYGDVGFPSRLNNCEACHTSGSYDLTANAAALPNMLWSTEATYANPTPAPYVRSPYTPTDFTTLGFGFTTSSTVNTIQVTGTPTTGTMLGIGATAGTKIDCTKNTCNCSMAQPCTVPVAKANCSGGICTSDDTVLVTSPIVAACVRCHDSTDDLGHMRSTGGSFYEAYGTAKTKMTAQTEQCLLCHGQGKLADISMVHMGK